MAVCGVALRSSAVCGVVLLALAGPATGQSPPLRGTLHVVWDDWTDTDDRSFHLVASDGRSVRLLPGGADAEELTARDGRLVEVSGRPVAAPGPTEGERAVRVDAIRALPGGVPTPAAASAAATDFVTLLCRFADDDSTPFTAGQVETVHGSTYPGVQHFYAELSGDSDIMAGRAVRGWYELPRPRSAYVIGESTDVGALVRDCTTAADADVDFSQFYGVNLQLNGDLSRRSMPPNDVLSFGGGWTLELDGESRSYGVTWLSGEHFDNYVVVTHEMGHALGWPHSSGKYGQEYDSRWDVMSVGYFRFEEPWGWLTIHTIAHHKNLAGWIPSDRRWVPAEGATETATIVRSALPPPTGHLMAEIPLGPGRSYTIESRLVAGHDHPLPNEAVVIHETQGSRAYVIDPDNDGDPNDDSAQWLPGETFSDPAAGVSVTVEEKLADGFVVTISRETPTCTVAVSTSPAAGGTATVVDGGVTGECGRTVTLAASPAEGWIFLGWREGGAALSVRPDFDLLLETDRTVSAGFVEVGDLADRLVEYVLGGGAPVTQPERALLDREGNANGTLDVGDLVAFFDAHPGAGRAGPLPRPGGDR